ncbi:unnamed protein product [Prorocentrum cordatum]|uniref:Uncharacterized protein n=1 Tax=Prorocentrum cordatum TaxID=2364126 RepID=A0ABN9QAV4_9DINO|nr:unnamed protein product [Polarella glacialis]
MARRARKGFSTRASKGFASLSRILTLTSDLWALAVSPDCHQLTAARAAPEELVEHVARRGACREAGRRKTATTPGHVGAGDPLGFAGCPKKLPATVRGGRMRATRGGRSKSEGGKSEGGERGAARRPPPREANSAPRQMVNIRWFTMSGGKKRDLRDMT